VAIDDEVVARFPAAELPVARALINKSVALQNLDRTPEALSACDALVSRFGAATDPKLREAVAGALLNKGEMARGLGHEEEATTAYREVIARFRDATEPVLVERVAQAYRELDAIQTLL
jgi:tetratricopeptide (TPR) repeat protein